MLLLPAPGRWLHASLPQEPVCSENLAPWLKLLPCRDAAGLPALLHRPSIYSASYHSMGIAMRRLAVPASSSGNSSSAGAGSSGGAGSGSGLAAAELLDLTQTLALVLRPKRAAGAAGAAGSASTPAPAANRAKIPSEDDGNEYAYIGGTGGGGVRGWDLLETLGSRWRGACPAAAESTAFAEVPAHLIKAAYPKPVATLRCEPAAGPPAAGSSGHPAGSSGQPADSVLLAHRVSDLIRDQASLGIADVNSSTLDGSSGGTDDSEAGARGGGCAPPANRRPRFLASWHVAGRGLLEGRLVLSLERSGAARKHGSAGCSAAGGAASDIAGAADAGGLGGAAAAAHAAHGSSAGSGDGCGASSDGDPVCVRQVLPWYVRVWLHTLQLSLDGQPVPLQRYLLAREVAPAVDRAAPLVLELCLRLPAAMSRAALTVDFTRGFLRSEEYPTDAARGFDIPPTVVSYVADSCGAAAAGGATAAADVAAAAAAGGWRSNGSLAASPLLAAVAPPAVAQQHTEGLLIALAAPDFSMPYNVICITSTLMAIFVGSTLNALLQRRSDPDAKASGGAGNRREKVKKALRVAALAVGIGAAAIYFDPDTREQAVGLLGALGIPADVVYAAFSA